MVNGIGNSMLVTSQSSVSSTQDRGDADGQNNGIVARGVGMLKKAWLHLTGQAKSAHNAQLSDLKAQVHNEIGEAGLSALNNLVSEKNWDGPNSTKLFSSSELDALRSDAFVQVRSGTNFSELENQTSGTSDAKDNAVDPEMRYARNFDEEMRIGQKFS